jgi:hypothetical protein
MGMVGVAINGIDFTIMVFNDAAHYLLQFIPERFFNKIIPAFYGENKLYVQLGVCVCHRLKMLGRRLCCLEMDFFNFKAKIVFSGNIFL